MNKMNPLDAYNKVYSALVLWQTHTGKYPARVYLGAEEYAGLEVFAHMFATKTNTGARDFTFCGMTVFQVVAESHISFGWDGESPCS